MNMEPQFFLISDKKTILDAFTYIDKVSVRNSGILFVTSTEGKIVGSVSDGDCRRGLINGMNLDASITKVMKRDFIFLERGKYNIETIIKIRESDIKFVPELNPDGTLFAVRDFSNGQSYIPVDAVLMAGGQGKRLQPLTLTTPKPLLKVADKPIIDYNIDNLIYYGIEHINITVNYLAEQLEEHFKEPYEGHQIRCIREGKYLGTIGSLNMIRDWHSDTILLMNSDLFTNIDLEAFYIHFRQHDADMSVATVPYNVSIPYGIFEIENEREIKGLKEKPSFYYHANAGIYLIKRKLLDLIPKDSFYDATDFMLRLIGLGKKVIRWPMAGYWIDIGKPEDFRKAQEFARNVGGSSYSALPSKRTVPPCTTIRC